MNKPKIMNFITKRLLVAMVILGFVGLVLPRVSLNLAQSFKINIGFGTDEPSPSPSATQVIGVMNSPSPIPSSSAKPRASHSANFFIDPEGQYWIDFSMGEGRTMTNKNSNYWFRGFCVVSPPPVVAQKDLNVVKAQKLVGGTWVSATDAIITTSVPGSDGETDCPEGIDGWQIYVLYTGGLGGLQQQAESGEVATYRSIIKGGQYGDTFFGDNIFQFTVTVTKAN
jgi:hypothetical protein